MPYDVQISEVSPQLLAAARGHGNKQNFLPRLFELLDSVWRFLKANPQIKHQGLNVFLYYGEAGKAQPPSLEGNPIEAGVKVVAPFASDGSVVCSSTPGGRVASATHIGPYEKLGDAHAAVRGWCKENNLSIAGTSWEIYDHWNEDSSKLRTDVFYLLK